MAIVTLVSGCGNAYPRDGRDGPRARGWQTVERAARATPGSRSERMMKAVRFSQFGGPEVLEIVDLPDPHPGPGQIRIAVGEISKAVVANPSLARYSASAPSPQPGTMARFPSPAR